MNWGKGITIVIILFMGFIASFVVRAFQRDSDLVRVDYYEHELNFDVNKQKKINFENLNSTIEIHKNDDGIYFVFPREISSTSTGKIMFYRPDAIKLDRQYSLDINPSNEQKFNYEDFAEGTYELTIEMNTINMNYIFEDIITF